MAVYEPNDCIITKNGIERRHPESFMYKILAVAFRKRSVK